MEGMSFHLLRCRAHSSPAARRWRDHLSSLHRVSPPLTSLKVYHTPDEELVHHEPDLIINRTEELKQRVRMELMGVTNPVRTMTSIDTIQRLGIGYHFEEETVMLLDRLYDVKGGEDNLFSTALHFRLLRQEGYSVDPEVFHKFRDSEGRFKEVLRNDLSGLLSLHEASYMGASGEQVLTEAMVFSKQHLGTSMLHLGHDEVIDITLALASPRQWRTTRFEARNFIEKYGHQSGMSSDILELASLDFNIVQSLNQQEIAELVNWWRELDLISKLSFARDRPLECYLWTLGIFPDPCYSRCRIEIAKVVSMILVIDDIYDNYASLEELLDFTNAIRRWDIDALGQLPEYMKICYMALYNIVNEIGYKILKDHGCDVVPNLAKVWIDLCEAYLIEARWFNSGVVPNLEDYISNGVTSAGTFVALVHASYLMGEKFNMEDSTIVNSYMKLFTCAGRVLRLWDDLGTARAEQERGDVASSIECYMKENENSSEDDARRHVNHLIHKAWQDLNRESAARKLPQSIIKASLNLARTAQFIYQHEHDSRFPSVKGLIHSLLEKPIHIQDFKSSR